MPDPVCVAVLQPAAVSGAVLRPGGFSVYEQRDGTEYPRPQDALPPHQWPQELERLSVALRALCGALTSGGSKMRPGDNNWSSRPPGLIAPAGTRCVQRRLPHSMSNSRAFASAIGARPILLHLRIAGLPLLRRDFCPHGFFLLEPRGEPLKGGIWTPLLANIALHGM